MKISCQSCHAKYNIADEKIQGKIVKIRCRKCGTTIVVNASGSAAPNGASRAPGPVAATGPTPGAPPPAAEHKTAAPTTRDTTEWHVSVAENDQRTWSVTELVTAYNAGVIAHDTFVWTEGMDDWRPLGEIDALVSLLRAAAAPDVLARGGPSARSEASSREPDDATRAYDRPTGDAANPPRAYEPPPASDPTDATRAYERSELSEPSEATRMYERPAPSEPGNAKRPYERPAAPGAGFAGLTAAPAPRVEEPKRAAVRREARARDLFATRTGEEGPVAPAEIQRSAPHATEAPIDDGKLTGQRNENSVLFSLEHLTRSAEERSVPDEESANSDDSGIIDLKALAAKAESMRPQAMPDMNALSPSLGFSSPLGAPIGANAGSDAQTKSKLPLLLGGGVGIALLLVLGIVIGLKLGGSAATSTASSAATVPLSASTTTATAEPSTTATSTAAAQASSNTATGASVATTPLKPRPYGAGPWHAAGTGKPPQGGAGGGGGAAVTGAAGAGVGVGGGAAAGGAPAGGGAAPPKKNDCGCNGDLMCMMKCSTK
jgi:predicted Zn finger-like uncharacterized protein